jgi:uncharacterized protein (TIGR03083 family)
MSRRRERYVLDVPAAPGTMGVSEHVEAIRAAGGRLLDSAEAAGLGATVPSCPGWTIRELVRHQGGVHRWATSIVATPRRAVWDVDLDEVVGSWPADEELLDWFADGCTRLVEAIRRAPAGLACWTFLTAPSPLAMWARRQAHETTIHAVDAELAAGRTPTTAPSLAADGVDELLTCFVTRPGGSLRSPTPITFRVRCTDIAGDWCVRISNASVQVRPGQPDDITDGEVAGQASDLYLTLWNRQSPDALTMTGDPAGIEMFLDRVKVRWS